MTNEPKHTPSPWAIANPTAGNNQDYRIQSYGKYEVIATVPAATDIPWDERAANAEFITRACNSHYELLEALEETHLLLSGLELEGLLPKLGKEQRAKIFSTNVQAIQKAKGEA